ncbi:integrating conjugative element protein [Legionella sp. 16cNR16C]|uniref:integrating conjugative element protein n=1 Tax=Legionella sp. 16cNR16C TaxID=2905656 RepID=UPI001E57B7BC|nr:integrating conjugative element protein [Legionella sp. 16cNR16C]MCE3045387.1 integrating conjugative element protein [Legionella sp. 16cNR16C]
MKKLSVIAGLLMSISCYAWQIINTEQYIKEMQSQLTEESLKLQEKLDARLPVSSEATVGKVNRKPLKLTNFTQPVFIIGDDEVSRQWLQEHTEELEAAHALGFVTNVTESEQLQTLQQLTKASLLPANVDDLMALFQEDHYPLAFIEGELWQ